MSSSPLNSIFVDLQLQISITCAWQPLINDIDIDASDPSPEYCASYTSTDAHSKKKRPSPALMEGGEY
jgi:hypothetical protein